MVTNRIDRNRPNPHLERIDVNLRQARVTRTRVADAAAEFPRVSSNLWNRTAQFVYTIGDGPGHVGGGVLEAGNAIIKYDAVTGRSELARMGRGRATSEAAFVADPDRRAEEDGGWLLAYVYDESKRSSDLVIVDAQDMTGGAVASVDLGARVPFGFHGNWFGDAPTPDSSARQRFQHRAV
ncbi:MAG TPA: carotenoid oxygenase family protein [Ilumatobacteraceae bacterium]|nr:carotenoid oxygenase family protein [Ilumatobacteraceae bacterium]